MEGTFRLAYVALFASLTGLGCQSFDNEADFDRHRMSSIRVAENRSDVYLFEARTSPDYPADSAAAEAVRMEWLRAWMKLRKFCPTGFDVVERRAFEPDEFNRYGSDLRYEVKCAGQSENKSVPAD